MEHDELTNLHRLTVVPDYARLRKEMQEAGIAVYPICGWGLVYGRGGWGVYKGDRLLFDSLDLKELLPWIRGYLAGREEGNDVDHDEP